MDISETNWLHNRKGNEPTIMILYTVKELKAMLNHSINESSTSDPPNDSGGSGHSASHYTMCYMFTFKVA